MEKLGLHPQLATKLHQDPADVKNNGIPCLIQGGQILRQNFDREGLLMAVDPMKGTQISCEIDYACS